MKPFKLTVLAKSDLKDIALFTQRRNREAPLRHEVSVLIGLLAASFILTVFDVSLCNFAS